MRNEYLSFGSEDDEKRTTNVPKDLRNEINSITDGRVTKKQAREISTVEKPIEDVVQELIALYDAATPDAKETLRQQFQDGIDDYESSDDSVVPEGVHTLYKAVLTVLDSR